MAKELRRELGRATRALQRACWSLHQVVEAGGDLLPGDLAGRGLAGEALLEVTRWLRGRASLVPGPWGADLVSPFPFRDPWEARVVLNPAERLEGLLALHEMRIALREAVGRGLGRGVEGRTAARAESAMRRILEVVEALAGEQHSSGLGDVQGLGQATARVLESMGRAARALRATHPHAAARLRHVRAMVVLPLAHAIRRLENAAECPGDQATGTPHGRVLARLRVLADSMDPLRPLGVQGVPEVGSCAVPLPPGEDDAREDRWKMAPLLILRLFDRDDPRNARKLGRSARILFRILRSVEQVEGGAGQRHVGETVDGAQQHRPRVSERPRPASAPSQSPLAPRSSPRR